MQLHSYFFQMKQQVSGILKNFRYADALRFYKSQFPNKKFTIEQLEAGEDLFNSEKLKSLLEEFYSTIPEIILESQEPSNEAQVQTKTETISDESEKDWKDPYKKAAFLFARIKLLKTDEERKNSAFQILELMDEVERIFEAIDFKKAHGKLPDYDYKGYSDLTDFQKSVRINTLKTYISKERKKDPDSPKIGEYLNEISILKALLNG